MKMICGAEERNEHIVAASTLLLAPLTSATTRASKQTRDRHTTRHKLAQTVVYVVMGVVVGCVRACVRARARACLLTSNGLLGSLDEGHNRRERRGLLEKLVLQKLRGGRARVHRHLQAAGQEILEHVRQLLWVLELGRSVGCNQIQRLVDVYRVIWNVRTSRVGASW